MFLQMTINGLMAGFALLLMALAFQIQLGVMRIVIFNLGELFMLAAFITWYFIAVGGQPAWVAVVLAIIIVCLVGVLEERGLLRKLRGQLLPQVVITVGVLLGLQTVALLLFGTPTRSVPTMFPGQMRFGGIILTTERLVTTLAAGLIFIGIYIFWKLSRLGQAMRAFSQDPEAAMLQGVSVSKLSTIAMVITCALTAVAGVLLGPMISITPYVGGPILLKTMVVATMAGMGSVEYTIVAALIIGLLDSYLTTLFGVEVSGIAYFGILVILLLLRPRGFAGEELHIR